MAVLILLSLFTSFITVQPSIASFIEEESFVKECMPDFGQHSGGWCWVASLANSLYWYKHTGGYPNLYPDDWDTTPIPEPGNPACSYRKLLDEIAKAGNRTYCQGIFNTDYLNTIQELLNGFNYSPSYKKLTLHVIEMPGFYPLTVVGPVPTSPGPHIETLDPLVKVSIRDPTFDDYKRELKRCQDVLLWLGDGSSTTPDHVVTGVSFKINLTGMYIDIADPWTHGPGHDDQGPGGPDHNNSTSHDLNPYEEYKVLSPSPLTIEYPNPTLRIVMKLIFISPEEKPVGGTILSPADFGSSKNLGWSVPFILLAVLVVMIGIVGMEKLWLRKRDPRLPS